MLESLKVSKLKSKNLNFIIKINIKTIIRGVNDISILSCFNIEISVHLQNIVKKLYMIKLA